MSLLSKCQQTTSPKKTGYVLFIIIASLIIHAVCISQTSLFVEETYYWNYGQHLDFGYLDHPPLVGLLIKASTAIFGINEFGVRVPAFLSWCISAFFSYRLSQLIYPGTGLYAVMLLAILPFYFFQSLMMTPDAPLIACWSASLYFLYRALVLNQAKAWYFVGISLGFGMLSKYTIVLLGLSSLYYVLFTPLARSWFGRKEPYLAVLTTALIFSPVLYWNATHEWISFLFQSQRRFASTTSIDIHYLIALMFLFITPLGVFELWRLVAKSPPEISSLNSKALRFLRVFIFVPLIFFATFSLNHEINLNWIGPLFLALLPWIAYRIEKACTTARLWFIGAFGLLAIYLALFAFIALNTSEQIQQKVFIKLIDWEEVVKQFNTLAAQLERETGKTPIFIPLDNFPIGSELSFYQAKLLAQKAINKGYPIIGSHVFGEESLMYRYWSDATLLQKDPPLILITKESWRFLLPKVTQGVRQDTPMHMIWSQGMGQNIKNIPYYYKVVQMKN